MKKCIWIVQGGLKKYMAHKERIWFKCINERKIFKQNKEDRKARRARIHAWEEAKRLAKEN